MLAKEIMTKELVTVRPETPVREIAKLLIEKGISGVPVVSKHGAVLGIVSEGDLILQDKELRPPSYISILGGIIYLEDPYKYQEEIRKVAAQRAEEIMTKEVIAVAEDTPVERCASIMAEKKVNRLPVVSHGKIVGIITRSDVIRAFAK